MSQNQGTPDPLGNTCQPGHVSSDVTTYLRPPRQYRRIPEEIVTEGDIQMELLLQKQLRTDVSSRDQRKEFVTGALFESEGSSDMTKGTVSLEEYSRLMEANERAEELRQFGLTDDEIALKLDSEKTDDGESTMCEPIPAKKLRPLADQSDRVRRLGDINEKIAERQRRLAEPTVFSGARLLTRHERDLERAITHDLDRTKFTGCLLGETPVGGETSGDMRDPINHLEEIWKGVLERGAKTSEGVREGKRSRRRRKRAEKKQAMESVDETVEECDKDESPFIGCFSKEETIKRDPLFISNRLETEGFDTCSHESVRSCEGSVETNHVRIVEEIPVDVIERHRLDVTQIRELARFKDYHPGIPSQTLYLKNMSPRVSLEDLVSMFGRYEKPNELPITYKLLGGRMRGQAFVTFHSTDSATSALQLVNGYDFKGRHIIIQYGKKTTEELTTDKGTVSNIFSLTSY